LEAPDIKHSLKIGLLLSTLFFLTSVIASDSPIIAAASSVKFALQDIAKAFKKDKGKSVRFSFASSGNLTRQIQQGAPFEFFLSANSQYVEKLQKQKLAQDNKIIYALGRLVLLTTVNSMFSLDEQLQGIHQAIKEDRLKRFAIANPEHAPYGVAAQEALQHQKIWSLIQPNLVLGENVAQATQFTESGAAQAGLVSYSLALAPALKNKTHWVLIPQSYHQPIEQTMVLLNNAGHVARQFYQYLQQEKAGKILAHYGYTLPQEK
jgi:molybdate transport system substrate-binding protein